MSVTKHCAVNIPLNRTHNQKNYVRRSSGITDVMNTEQHTVHVSAAYVCWWPMDTERQTARATPVPSHLANRLFLLAQLARELVHLLDLVHLEGTAPRVKALHNTKRLRHRRRAGQSPEEVVPLWTTRWCGPLCFVSTGSFQVFESQCEPFNYSDSH